MMQNVLQQQQQQNALLVALLQQQQQQNALRTALLQQQRNVSLPSQSQNAAVPPQNAGTTQLRTVSLPSSKEPQKPQDPEEAAARQLKMTRDLLTDADAAQQEGERDRAAKMRERAETRLQEIVATYPGTKAADKARELLGMPQRVAKLGS
jgi:hypothetical protein